MAKFYKFGLTTANLQQLDQGRQNNFDLLRLIAATMVIFSHSYLVTNNFKNEPLAKLCGFLDFGSLGVKIFFAVSGYLITKSIFKQPTLQSFVWSRFLRIFPGLILTALFCAFIIGPLCTALPMHTYFTNTLTYKFILQLTTLHNFGDALPGVFITNPYPKAVNSPIWTLNAELLMYLAVLLLGIVLLLWQKQYRKLLIAVPVLIVVFIFFATMQYPGYYWGYIHSWGILFLLGACCYLLRGKIPVSIPVMLCMLPVFFLLFHFRWAYLDCAFDVMLVYGILVFSYHPKLQVNGFHKLGDFSYGLYIYAFPIQQFLIFKFPSLTPLTLFGIAFVLTFALAAASWFLVEKQMLKLKNKTLNHYKIMVTIYIAKSIIVI